MSGNDATSILDQDPEQIGDALASLVEDQWFERKSARIGARELGAAIAGLANADGGVLVVGIHDGVVEGTDDQPKRRNAQMQANIDFCVPPVRAQPRLLPCRRSDGVADHLLIFEIQPGESVHADTRDQVFLRVGDENRKLSFAQRRELLFDKGQANYEARRLDGVGIGLVKQDLLQAYADATGAPDPVRLMKARGLAVGEDLTIAGCLLFHEAPQTHLPEAFVRVLRYQGRERGTGSRQQLLADVRVEGPIPDQLLDARSRIRELQPVRRALREDGRFGDVPLVPEDAWLEAVVNAAIHRSYSMGGDHTRIEIFDDRIEVSSPGRFPGLVNLAEPFEAPRFARNPRIARVCKDLDFGQELGEGIRRMYEEMRYAGLTDPIYRQTAGSVEVTLSTEMRDRRLDEQLGPRTRTITAALRTAGRLSTGEVAELLGASRPVAQRELKALEDAGVVEWVGKSPRDPRAYWQVKPR